MSQAKEKIDWRRYRKVRAFFFRAFIHAFWWDFLLLKQPLRRFRKPPLERWLKLTQGFRDLALEMGGILIKLAQFMSTRLDLLPREITQELRGLQDSVAPVSLDKVVRQIEEDFGRPSNEVFARFEDEPIGAASIAQVYRAELFPTPGEERGREVVVKVLRPGIDVLVETDLRAISMAIRGLRLWSFIRRRVDLDRLVHEFVTTTRRELDMGAEGRHAERFAENFADDDGVLIPRIFWQQSAQRTLTLENVGFIKFGDFDVLAEAGIDRSEVAAKLYDTYLRQLFVHNFLHADPHPGNLFIRPIGEKVEGKTRAFQIAFVDFGMVASIPERLRASLREYVIALGTRDAYRLVKAYQQAGVLLPGADINRITEAHEIIFDRIYGVKIGELRDRAMDELGPLLSEYRDLLLDTPMQAQVDLVFVQRAVEILIGMVTFLDPKFDLWEAMQPFTRRLIREGQGSPKDGWGQELLTQARTAFALPARFDRFLQTAERGNLDVRTNLGPDARRAVLRLERAIGRLTLVVLGSALGLASTIIYVVDDAPNVALAGMIGGVLIVTIALLRRLGS